MKQDIQETISIIETFQNLKRLQFREEKTKKSIINGKKDKTIYINGIEIERTKSHKYLGKIIEENGKIKEEIKERIKITKRQVNQVFQVIDKNELSSKRIEVGNKATPGSNNANTNIWSRNMEQVNRKRKKQR